LQSGRRGRHERQRSGRLEIRLDTALDHLDPVAGLPLRRADSRGAKNPLRRSSLHLQGLLRSPVGFRLRLASPLWINLFNRNSAKYFIHYTGVAFTSGFLRFQTRLF
jgi:hypothetical protein